MYININNFIGKKAKYKGFNAVNKQKKRKIKLSHMNESMLNKQKPILILSNLCDKIFL